MNRLQDMLRDADPVRHDDLGADERRAQIRRTVLAAAANVTRAPAARRLSPALWIVIAPIIILFVALGFRVWSGGSATLHAAAVRFEVRLAEAEPTLGLRPARVAGSNRTIYLHQDAIVTNEDILQSRTVPGNDESHFSVAVTLTPVGGDKMRRATAVHVGRPVGFLLDGEVVMAPTVRSPIGAEGLITGDFSKAEADRIANGMMIR
jgi:hypothetical protein